MKLAGRRKVVPESVTILGKVLPQMRVGDANSRDLTIDHPEA